MSYSVAILGGTGRFGQGLARRLVAGGHGVVIGSRSPERAEAAAAAVGGGAVGRPNEEATAGVDIVVFAVPPADAEATARILAPALAGMPVVSVVANLVFEGGRPAMIEDGDPRSLAERIQAAAPEARVAAAFHTVAAAALGGAEPPADDVLVCADDADAREATNRLVAACVSGRAVDAGPLAAARFVEPFTAAILWVNRRAKAHAGIALTGLP